ncbi:uncharacterized protein LOC136030506 [Artemia franciscana]|uniref:uncharacterized protein LOC136030506 n=1 Tax=Artemia franciscana TaxID=6661 RepID=UPI0032DBB7F9
MCGADVHDQIEVTLFPWFYMIALPFVLATLVVHLLLPELQNLQGQIVMSHIVPTISSDCVSMTIHSVKEADCGTYTCKMTNACGDVSVDVTLHLLGKEIPSKMFRTQYTEKQLIELEAEF